MARSTCGDFERSAFELVTPFHAQGTSGPSQQPSVGSLTSNYKAVIGSLPKGLTMEDKMKLVQALPMSPSRALLQEMGVVRCLRVGIDVHSQIGWGRPLGTRQCRLGRVPAPTHVHTPGCREAGLGDLRVECGVYHLASSVPGCVNLMRYWSTGPAREQLRPAFNLPRHQPIHAEDSRTPVCKPNTPNPRPKSASSSRPTPPSPRLPNPLIYPHRHHPS